MKSVSSPGSQAQPSRSPDHSFQEFLDSLTDFTITVNGSSKRGATSFDESSEISFGDVCTLQRVPPTYNEPLPSHARLPLLDVLTGETGYQNSFLREWCKVPSNNAIDTSTQGSGQFMPAQRSRDQSGDDDAATICQMSGKPDVCSTKCPMTLEIKCAKSDGACLVSTDWAVMKQAAERVAMTLRMSGFLARVTSFAMTDRSAWCVVATRSATSSSDILAVEFVRISQSTVSELWHRLTPNGSRKEWSLGLKITSEAKTKYLPPRFHIMTRDCAHTRAFTS